MSVVEPSRSVAHPAVTATRRGSAQRASIQVMVLSIDPTDLIGADMTSGVMVRARVPVPAGERSAPPAELPAPFASVEARLADPPGLDDPSQPETLILSSAPTPAGTVGKRRARRLIDPLLVSPRGPLLGFPGPAARYWTFNGASPSVVLVRLAGDLLVYRSGTGNGAAVRFTWRGGQDRLPLGDPGALAALEASRADRLGPDALRRALGIRPRYVLVALTPPIDGNCYKVVKRILPRP